jgi:hypothetical protein
METRQKNKFGCSWLIKRFPRLLKDRVKADAGLTNIRLPLWVALACVIKLVSNRRTQRSLLLWNPLSSEEMRTLTRRNKSNLCSWMINRFPKSMKGRVKADADRRHKTLRQWLIEACILKLSSDRQNAVTYSYIKKLLQEGNTSELRRLFGWL